MVRLHFLSTATCIFMLKPIRNNVGNICLNSKSGNIYQWFFIQTGTENDDVRINPKSLCALIICIRSVLWVRFCFLTIYNQTSYIQREIRSVMGIKTDAKLLLMVVALKKTVILKYA